MHEILRDREHVSLRLVMNPDRMVIDEARRTFTYLNLYGFLTDAVVVNRVFPDDVGDYFAAWRETQQEAIGEVDAAFAPVPVLHAPFFEQEVRGGEMLDRLGDALFDGRDAGDVLHSVVHAGPRRRPRRRVAAPGAAVRRQGRAAAARRSATSSIVRVGPAQADDAVAARRSPGTAPRVRRSRTMRW